MRALLLIPLLYFRLAASEDDIVIQVIQDVNLGGCDFEPTEPPEPPEPPFDCNDIKALNSSEELRNISVSIDMPLGYVFDCLWEVEVPQDYAVHFIWSRFEMGGDCDLGSVTVNNSLQSGEYCDSELPEPFTLFNGSNEVRMSTSQDWNGGGFSLEYSHIYVTGSNASCPSFTVIVKEGTSGSIAVESSSSTDDDLYCEWLLETPEGKIIDISFEKFELEYDDNCSNNALEFFDFPSFESLNGKMCGNSVPSNILTSSNRVLIRFSSNNAQNFSGFALNYTAVDPIIGTPDPCSFLPGVVVEGSSGSLSIGEDDYVNLLYCEWLIVTPENTTIEISFSRFDVEDCSPPCDCDSVQLFDTPPLYNLTEKMCGYVSPSSVSSHSNQVLIRFRTDGSDTDTGFELNYTAKAFPEIGQVNSCSSLPGVVVEGSSGSLSIGEDDYDDNLYCEWLLETPENTTMEISFSMFNLTGCSSSCDCDSVQLFNTPLLYSLTEKMCGNNLPSPVSSQSNQVLIRFITNGSVTYTGFELNYTAKAVPERDLVYSCSSLPGVVVEGSSGSLSVGEDDYDNNLYCEWLLETPENTTMEISFSRFDVEDCSPCVCDSVQLFNTSLLYSLTEKMCGNVLPSSVSSQSNQVLIRFRTDGSGTYTGFELNYTAKAVPEIVPPLICDDLKVLNVHRDGSDLTVWNESPDVNKLECVWLLKAPLHHVVQITFNQIEIGNCNGLASVDVEDEFYNGDQFCASGVLETYTSERNYVWLIFRTEWNWNGQGFSLQYTAIPE